jgi:capsular exopolysaccharide synthesis family protein
MERDARANQALLASVLTRIKETSTQQELDMFTPDAIVISHSDIPLSPSFPRTKLFLALSALGSVFVGLFFAFLTESLDQRLRSAVDVEEGLGIPLLALVPTLKGLGRQKKLPAAYVAENNSSALAQSIRALRTGISLAGLEGSPKTILVTSVQPSEGKTTISSCLAGVSAMTDSVVIVDADFHRPSLATALGVENYDGLADVLLGEAKLEDVIREDEVTGVHYITAGNATSDTASLLDRKTTKAVFDALSYRYDMVVIDSPPLMAVPDARILSGLADATVLVVRWGHTKRDVVRLGLRQILSSAGQLAGIVLAQVDVKKNSAYGHPDSGAYYGALSDYYAK